MEDECRLGLKILCTDEFNNENLNMFKAESATNHKVSQHVSQHVLTCAVRCIRSRSGRQAADTAEHPQDRGEAQPNSKA